MTDLRAAILARCAELKRIALAAVGRPIAVVAIGHMYGSDYSEEHESIRDAIEAGGWACEYNTWAIDRIEVGGRVVMERGEIIDRFDEGRFDDLPDVGVYQRALPEAGSKP